jgi:tripartite motif-containing protein 71
MAFDHQDNIIGADDDCHRLQVFRLSDGAPLSTIGGPGSGAGQLATPKGVAFDSAGNIFVAESGNHRVQELRYS